MRPLACRKLLFAILPGASALLLAAVLTSSARASDCAASAVTAPDGSALSVLFDDLRVTGDNPARTCTVSAPLALPAGYSLGVYRVDYRGFALLAKGQSAALTVDYKLGPKENSRHFSRKVRGPSEDEFAFTETIGAGLMKRIGCGSDATLSVSVTLALTGAGAPMEADLDSSDGASKRGVVFQFDLKKCGK
jgi:hypothetical protein